MTPLGSPKRNMDRSQNIYYEYYAFLVFTIVEGLVSFTIVEDDNLALFVQLNFTINVESARDVIGYIDANVAAKHIVGQICPTRVCRESGARPNSTKEGGTNVGNLSQQLSRPWAVFRGGRYP